MGKAEGTERLTELYKTRQEIGSDLAIETGLLTSSEK